MIIEFSSSKPSFNSVFVKFAAIAGYMCMLLAEESESETKSILYARRVCAGVRASATVNFASDFQHSYRRSKISGMSVIGVCACRKQRGNSLAIFAGDQIRRHAC